MSTNTNSSGSTPIIPTGLVPASAYRTLEDTLKLLSAFNVVQVKMVVMRDDGSYLESVLELHELNPNLFQGFQVGDQWVYPDPEKAFFNPFFKHGAVLSIPCFRQDQLLHFQQQQLLLQQQQQQQHQQRQVAAAAQVQAAHHELDHRVASSSSSEEDPSHFSQAPGFAGTDAKHAVDEAEVTAIAEMMVLNSQGVLPPPQSSDGGDMLRKKMLVRHESPVEGDMQYMSMQPIRKIPKKGTSCHQCKNTKHLQQLAFCTNAFEKRGKHEKRARNCRKKFCKVCLEKFYHEDLMEVLNSSFWKCPSCRGDCVCAACVRSRSNGEDCEDSVSEHTSNGEGFNGALMEGAGAAVSPVNYEAGGLQFPTSHLHQQGFIQQQHHNQPIEPVRPAVMRAVQHPHRIL